MLSRNRQEGRAGGGGKGGGEGGGEIQNLVRWMPRSHAASRWARPRGSEAAGPAPHLRQLSTDDRLHKSGRSIKTHTSSLD